MKFQQKSVQSQRNARQKKKGEKRRSDKKILLLKVLKKAKKGRNMQRKSVIKRNIKNNKNKWKSVEKKPNR